MINRTLIRIKTTQLLFAYYLNIGRNDEGADYSFQDEREKYILAEKELKFSLSKAYELYNYMLWLIVSVTRLAIQEVENEERLNAVARIDKPVSHRFIDNEFASQLEINTTLTDYVSDKKISWSNEIAYIKKLYNDIVQSKYYQEYMEKEEVNYEDDKDFWRTIYKHIIMKDERIDDILEDHSLYWNDDRTVIDTFVLKTIKKFEAKNGAKQELLPKFKDEQDEIFATKLFKTAIQNGDHYRNLISNHVRNWEFNRLAYTDIIIMQLAIAEFLCFQQIPTSVTINEYVEIAKWYSTPKSTSYVNGVLDSLARALKAEHKIMKD